MDYQEDATAAGDGALARSWSNHAQCWGHTVPQSGLVSEGGGPTTSSNTCCIPCGTRGIAMCISAAAHRPHPFVCSSAEKKASNATVAGNAPTQAAASRPPSGPQAAGAKRDENPAHRTCCPQIGDEILDEVVARHPSLPRGELDVRQEGVIYKCSYN
jgi:hypothetical protein